MTLKITPAKETGADAVDATAHETPALIDAVTARRKATGYVSNVISHLLLGRDPEYVEGTPSVWRVPIVLTFFDIGIVGTIGTIDVHATTGEILITSAQVEFLKKNAHELAQRTPPRAAR